MLDRLLAPLAELPPGRATLVVLGCSLAAAVLVEFVLVRALRTAVSWTDSSLDDVVVRALRLPLVVTAGFGGVFLLTRHPSVRSTLLAPEQWDAFLGNPALTVVVVVWAVGLNRAVGGVAERLQSGERRVDVAAAEEFVLDDPAPRMRFRRFGDFALEYELVCWVPSPHRVGRATHHLNRGLHDRLATAGIEVPYPKQEVSYRSADPADADAGRTDRDRDGVAVSESTGRTDGDGRATPGGMGHRGRAGLPPGVRTVPDRMRGAPEGARTRGPNQSSSEEPPDDS